MRFPPLLVDSLNNNYQVLSSLLDEIYGKEAQEHLAARLESDPLPSTLAYSQLMERLAKELIRERFTTPESVSGQPSTRDVTRALEEMNNTPTDWQYGDGSNGETGSGIRDLYASAMSAYALLNVSRPSAADDRQTRGDRTDIRDKGDGMATSETTRWGWANTIAAGLFGTGLTAATAYGALQLKE